MAMTRPSEVMTAEPLMAATLRWSRRRLWRSASERDEEGIGGNHPGKGPPPAQASGEPEGLAAGVGGGSVGGGSDGEAAAEAGARAALEVPAKAPALSSKAPAD